MRPAWHFLSASCTVQCCTVHTVQPIIVIAPGWVELTVICGKLSKTRNGSNHNINFHVTRYLYTQSSQHPPTTLGLLQTRDDSCRLFCGFS